MFKSPLFIEYFNLCMALYLLKCTPNVNELKKITDIQMFGYGMKSLNHMDFSTYFHLI